MGRIFAGHLRSIVGGLTVEQIIRERSGVARGALSPGRVGGAFDMDAERARRMVELLRARGVMAHLVEAGVYEFGIRVVLDGGIRRAHARG
ncbi:hypothetical protein [Streptomyces sp. NPDC050388]|uniref:hypothetical protein n=1 Tax=Streptomyces sp. NPDC050388 TaxID=3155781 RepID=UPI00342E6DAF